MATKRMGGLGKLSDFGQAPAAAPSPASSSKPEQPKPKSKPKPKQEEKFVTVNIKIQQNQQEWLADTARTIRSNNDAPVPPAERVFPQHLIQVAIDMLQTAEVDWENIRNVEDLREALNL